MSRRGRLQGRQGLLLTGSVILTVPCYTLVWNGQLSLPSVPCSSQIYSKGPCPKLINSLGKNVRGQTHLTPHHAKQLGRSVSHVA